MKEGLLASLRVVRTEAGIRFSTGLQTEGTNDRLSKTVNFDGTLADDQALAGRVRLAVSQVADAITQHLLDELNGEPHVEPREFDDPAEEGQPGEGATALLGAPVRGPAERASADAAGVV